ncbi:MAG: crossover junction endodeoxyribonuclease RuvC [Steroidobacteraceae bacterium]
MSRYRTKSWRAFDPATVAGGAAVSTVVSAIAKPAVKVRILGVDPGSRRTGFGVIECRGADYVHVAHGCLNVGGALMAERLRLIFDGLQALIGAHQPAEIAVERVFVNRNVESALKLGQARGAALCAVPKGLPVFEYAPRAIKLALVGSGAAEKSQVAHMITTLLQLSGGIGPDAADALAVAVCHAHSRRLHALAQAASARPAA